MNCLSSLESIQIAVFNFLARTMMRPLPKTFNILLLFVCVVMRTSYIDAKSVYKTKFLVGPEPQPVILGNSFADSLSPTDDVLLPVVSIPISRQKGNRNLKKRNSHVPKVYKDVGPSHRGFFLKNDNGKRASHDMRYANLTDSEPRLLVEEVGMITTSFLGSNNDDNGIETGFFSYPPDPIGAAGERRLVAVINTLMEVRFKNGTLIFRDGFPHFFSSLPEASEARFTDPKVIWDEHCNRFVIVVLQTGFSPNFSRIWFAVSKDQTPDYFKDWHKGYIDAVVNIGGEDAWVDYTGLEVDEEAVYITANMFTLSGSYAGVRLWVLEKDTMGGLYCGGALSYYVVNPYAHGGLAGTTMPTQVHGSGGVDGSVGTFLSSLIVYDDGRVDLEIVTIFNPLGSPTYTVQLIDLGVITQRALPTAPQLGTTSRIETIDLRVQDAVWRDNKLWVVFHVNPPRGVNQDQCTAHWVRCSTSGGTVTFEAQGDLGGEDIAPGTHTYFPSVAVNTKGVVAFGYSASSPTTYVGAYVSVGTSEQSLTVKEGLAPYFSSTGSEVNRWGDYTGISVDPTDDSFWIFNEFADMVKFKGYPSWGTVWARMVPLPTDCTITWNLYNTRTDTLVVSLINGATITNPPPCGKASIEVVAPCAAPRMKVGIELFQGSRLVKRRKASKYYFLFGTKGDNILDGKISAGSYSIRAIVNGTTTSPFTNFTLGGTCA
jgi:hypothetical protein